MFDRVLKVKNSVIEDGIRVTVHRVLEALLWRRLRPRAHRISEAYYEWRLGISSDGRVYPSELGIDNPDSNPYQASDYAGFRRVMRSLHIREGEDVFVDIGSGKGRIVILAATMPFREVIGVELSERLNSVAQDNVRRVRSRLQCRNIQLVTADATTYAIPPDATILYFYNPFLNETLRSVFENIRASLMRFPRGLTIVYKNSKECRAELAAIDWLRKTAEFPCREGPGYLLYQADVEAAQRGTRQTVSKGGASA